MAFCTESTMRQLKFSPFVVSALVFAMGWGCSSTERNFGEGEDGGTAGVAGREGSGGADAGSGGDVGATFAGMGAQAGSATGGGSGGTVAGGAAGQAGSGGEGMPACSPDETRCFDLEFRTCNGSGEWEATATCLYACNDDEGCDGECNAGDRGCSNGQLLTCDGATHMWNPPVACEDDGITCTDDVCDGGECVHRLKPSYCLIGENACYAHNQDDPGNPCRYCDALNDTTDWSDRASNVGCDDGIWCNGTDTCNGAGSCATHQYSSNNRCSGGSACANTCNEAQQNCYSPASTVCSVLTEYACESTACGADALSRTRTRYCTGSSSTCAGAEDVTEYQTASACSSAQVCTGQAGTTVCVADPQCECVASGNWYDTRTGLCWLVDPSPNVMNWAAAVTYCSGTFGGLSGWELPNVAELITLLRGCQNGTSAGLDENDLSQCAMSPLDCVQNDNCTATVTCNECSQDQGPSGGNYWPSALNGYGGPGYWSSNKGSNSGYYWRVSYSLANVTTAGTADSSYWARCVRRPN